MLAGLVALTNRTRIGKQMTATANDPGAASLSGVSTGRMIILAFAISAAIGALGGIASRSINSTNYLSGGIYALSGFVAAILGGWGSSTGAVVGGLALGIIESLATGFLPAGYQDAVAYALLILVLYFRPSGILGTGSEEAGMSAWIRRPQTISPPLLLGRRRSPSSAVVAPGRLALLLRERLHHEHHDDRRSLHHAHRGVVLILGQAGQLSFAHSAFYGIGAYTAALLAMKASRAHLAALIIGALVAGLIALIVGRPVLQAPLLLPGARHHRVGPHLPGPRDPVRTASPATMGLAPIPSLNIFGFTFGTNLRQYYLIWVVALLGSCSWTAPSDRMGRALRGIATSEIASSTLGVRTANWKLLAFVTSAVICGLAGGLFAFTLAASPRRRSPSPPPSSRSS